MQEPRYIKIRGVIKLIIVVGALIGIFIFILHMTSDLVAPATAEQVWNVLETQGYKPRDTTQIYRTEWDDSNNEIVNVVSIEAEDIQFHFFAFTTEDLAEYVRKKYRSFIRETRYSIPNTEHHTALGNYSFYWIKTNGTYTINIRVANTMVFACCDKEENIEKINEIVDAIGYYLS